MTCVFSLHRAHGLVLPKTWRFDREEEIAPEQLMKPKIIIEEDMCGHGGLISSYHLDVGDYHVEYCASITKPIPLMSRVISCSAKKYVGNF